MTSLYSYKSFHWTVRTVHCTFLSSTHHLTTSELSTSISALRVTHNRLLFREDASYQIPRNSDHLARTITGNQQGISLKAAGLPPLRFQRSADCGHFTRQIRSANGQLCLSRREKLPGDSRQSHWRVLQITVLSPTLNASTEIVITFRCCWLLPSSLLYRNSRDATVYQTN